MQVFGLDEVNSEERARVYKHLIRLIVLQKLAIVPPSHRLSGEDVPCFRKQFTGKTRNL